MPAPKVYLNCKTRQRAFQNGGTIISIGVDVNELIKFAQQHQNARGYLNLSISERKSVGQYGDTHSVSLDTWEPTRREGGEGRPAHNANEAPPPPDDEFVF